MKKLTFALIIAATSLTTSAFAASYDIQSTVTVQGIKSPVKSYISPEELTSISGKYILENGKTLSVTRQQNRIYVEAPGIEKTQVVATKPTQLVSMNNDLTLDFTTENTNSYTSVKAVYVLTQK
ncbi:hypothetical protein [Undibacterium sp.]|uniref:hypothetical protein n=1 Tax=Undibacterium sp. TaxID=1914977 RepID=UPI0037505207